MKKIGTIVAATLITVSLAGCGGTSAPTTSCSEYAKMDPDTGLLTAVNADQEAVLKKLLVANDKRDDDQDVLAAHLSVIAYCNIYDGVAGGNSEQPISNAF